MVRRHRLIERFLTDVLERPWDQVHEEAERLEHWMSPMLEERMLRAIGEAKTCPHGHPIFEGDARAGGAARRRGGGRERADPALRERGRGPAALPEGRRSSPRPGGQLASAGADEVVVDGDGGRDTVTRSVAETVSVVADPSPPPRTAPPEQLVMAREHWGR